MLKSENLNINYYVDGEIGDCNIYDGNMHLATIYDCLNITDKVYR